MPKTTRICAGMYIIKAAGRTYEVERWPDGAWLLFDVTDGPREFLNDYCTKFAALAAVRDASPI